MVRLIILFLSSWLFLAPPVFAERTLKFDNGLMIQVPEEVPDFDSVMGQFIPLYQGETVDAVIWRGDSIDTSYAMFFVVKKITDEVFPVAMVWIQGDVTNYAVDLGFLETGKSSGKLTRVKEMPDLSTIILKLDGEKEI